MPIERIQRPWMGCVPGRNVPGPYGRRFEAIGSPVKMACSHENMLPAMLNPEYRAEAEQGILFVYDAGRASVTKTPTACSGPIGLFVLSVSFCPERRDSGA